MPIRIVAGWTACHALGFYYLLVHLGKAQCLAALSQHMWQE